MLLWRAGVAAYEGGLEPAREYVNMILQLADTEPGVLNGKKGNRLHPCIPVRNQGFCTV